MAIYLGHTSALEYWRGNDWPPPDASRSVRIDRLGASCSIERKALAFSPPLSELTLPLEILVNGSTRRAATALEHPHYWKWGGLFLPLENIVFVASPADTVLQLAHDFDLPELLLLSYELCGTYRLPVRGEEPAYGRPACMTPESLRRALYGREGMHGIKKIRLVLRYLLPKSGSPMETVLVLVLTLPPRLGGYGLPTPVLNVRCYIDESGMTYYIPDLWWRDRNVVLEYFGGRDHTELHDMVLDNLRRNDLLDSGQQVLVAVYEHLANGASMDHLAAQLSHQLGLGKIDMSREARERRRELRTRLLRWRGGVEGRNREGA